MRVIVRKANEWYKLGEVYKVNDTIDGVYEIDGGKWLWIADCEPIREAGDIPPVSNIEKKAEDYANKYVGFGVLRDAAEAAFIAGYNEREEWISVQDRLPEIETQVLVVRPNRYSGKVDIIMAYLHDGGESGRSYGRLGEQKWLYGKYWSFPAVSRLDSVTHWMPLPQPPKRLK